MAVAEAENVMVCAYLHRCVTKTISLSDDAYEALLAAKRPGESFSDVARRLAALDRRNALFDPNLRLSITEEEAERILDNVYRWRDESLHSSSEDR